MTDERITVAEIMNAVGDYAMCCAGALRDIKCSECGVYKIQQQLQYNQLPCRDPYGDIERAIVRYGEQCRIDAYTMRLVNDEFGIGLEDV